MKIDFSIIISIYNGERFLEKCIESILSQKRISIEIICIDDGSTDSTQKILQDYKNNLNNLTIISHKNIGLGASRNKGIDLAKGRYIQFLDVDDQLDENGCRELYVFMERHSLDMGSYSGWNIINFTEKRHNPYWEYKEIPERLLNSCHPSNIFFPYITNLPVSSCLSIYRRFFLNKYKIRFPEGLFFEDNLFFYRAFFKARRYGILKKKLYLRNIHSGQITQRNDATLLDIFPITKYCYDLFRNYLGIKEAAAYARRKFSHINEISKNLNPDLRSEWGYKIQELKNHINLKSINEIQCRYEYDRGSNNEIIKMNKKNDTFQYENSEKIQVGQNYTCINELSLSKKPTISVIVPVYNKELYLNDCMESLLTQDQPNVEIICVNDGSTDRSLDILLEKTSQYNQISLICTQNYGAAKARNLALKIASGQYIFFIDADDYLPTKDTLRLLYSKALKYKAQIIGGSLLIEKNGQIQKVSDVNEEKMSFTKEGWTTFKDFQYDYGFTRFLYSNNLLKDNNILFPNFKIQEDPIFLIKALHYVNHFYCIKDTIYIYRKTKEKKEYNIFDILNILKSLKRELIFSNKYKYENLFYLIISRLTKQYMLKNILNFKENPYIKKELINLIKIVNFSNPTQCTQLRNILNNILINNLNNKKNFL